MADPREVMIVKGVNGRYEERPLTAPVPPPPATPLPGHLLLLLTHVISLCESVSKCAEQFRRFAQYCEDLTNVDSFTQLRSCHRHCPIMQQKHLLPVVKLCLKGSFDLEQFGHFKEVMENVFKGKYFLEGAEAKFIRSQFRFAYNLIKQARFEFGCLLRFNYVIIALLDMPHDRNSEPWIHAVGSFPYILEVAQSQWKAIAFTIGVELEVSPHLPTLFVSSSVQNLVEKFWHMIEREPKCFIRGGEEDFSSASSLSCDSDGTYEHLKEQRCNMLYDMRHSLKIDFPVSEESASDDDD